jgi:hypothetical protein
MDLDKCPTCGEELQLTGPLIRPDSGALSGLLGQVPQTRNAPTTVARCPNDHEWTLDEQTDPPEWRPGWPPWVERS